MVQQTVEVGGIVYQVSEPRGIEEWVEMLELLSKRLAQGRIYKRDLPTLVRALNHLLKVVERRLEER